MNFIKRNKKWVLILFFLMLFAGFALYPISPHHPVKYYDRGNSQLKTESIYGEKWLIWLYNNPVGEATLWTLAKRKVVSSTYGEMMDKPSSVDKINPFVKEYKVDLSIAQKQKFTSFNDFFTRKLKPQARPIDSSKNVAVSPADGKILAYQNLNNSDFYIKGMRFNVTSFLENQNLAEKFKDGSLIVVRLAPPDYHRFHFPVSGTTSTSKKIDGNYYSVNPLALRKMAEIFWMNKREYTLIKDPEFGEVVMSEVGATMVGSIIQTYKGNVVQKGEEKGYFKFGGSTVVLLFEKNKVKIDADFLINTKKGYETTVKMGEEIGKVFNAEEIKE